MLGLKNPILVNRKIYAFKGIWQNPQEDIQTPIYYFISQKQTLTEEFVNGRETLTPVMEITCYGEHQFANGDFFTLQNGEKYIIRGISNDYFENNIAVRDLLKQRISNQVLILK